MTTSPKAGTRLLAAGAAFPAIASAAASAPVTVSNATLTDIPGVTITVTTQNAGASVLVIGVFDILVATAGVATALGSCIVDGGVQPGEAIHDLVTLNTRETVTQTWNVTLGAAGTHTIKLQASLNGTGGSATFNGTHCTITALILDW